MEFTWDVVPLFRVFGILIRYYSLFFIAVYIGAWIMLRWQIVRGGGKEDDATIFMLLGIALTWIGGRVFHFGFYDWDIFINDPSVFFDIKRGGIASHGSAFFLIVGMWAYTRWKATPFLDGLDRLSFGAAWGAGVVRLGNLFNSEIVGRVTDQTWGVRFPRYDRGLGEVPLRHPSQIYEFFMGMAVLGLLFLVDRKFGGESRPRGLLFFTFLFAYFGGRFLVEYFKEYQTVASDFPFTMGQLLSIAPASIGLVGIIWSLKRHAPAGWGSLEAHAEEE